MPRRILIVRTLDDDTIAQAEADDIGEILIGIPPRLRGEIDPGALPLVWEEPEPAVDPSIAAADAELTRLAGLLMTDWAGSEAAWASLSAADKATHLRVRTNALRDAVLWLYQYNVARDTSALEDAG